ncbi:MAG: TnpV protein, partial [Oscillospiraceae bacterium]|nr:TnpV protein [Oscillospiraceae bacterium]
RLFHPGLKLRKTPPIGKYGLMRKRYLKEHQPILYNKLVLSESLFPHLLEIEAAANRRIEGIFPALMKDTGVTENLKAADPMKWVGLMNTCHAQAEEIVLAELIYN